MQSMDGAEIDLVRAKEFGVGGLADSRSPPFFPGRALPCLRQRRGAGEIKPNLL